MHLNICCNAQKDSQAGIQQGRKPGIIVWDFTPPDLVSQACGICCCWQHAAAVSLQTGKPLGESSEPQKGESGSLSESAKLTLL